MKNALAESEHHRAIQGERLASFEQRLLDMQKEGTAAHEALDLTKAELSSKNGEVKMVSYLIWLLIIHLCTFFIVILKG